MKKILGTVAMSAAVLGLMGCAEDRSSGGSGGDSDELNFWVFGATNYEELAAQYMEENPDVKIKVNFTEMGDLHNNLFTAVSSNSGAPDITMIEVSEISKFLDAQDRFHNLYEFGAEDVKGDYLDWKWNIAESTDGEFLMGLPTDIGPSVMYYRKDVFEEAGLPTEPEEVQPLVSDWAGFEETAKIIHDTTGKMMVDTPETLFAAKRDQAPEQYFNTEDELIIEDSPYVKQAYDDTAEMIQQDLVGQNAMWTPEWGNAMAEGSYGALLAPAWMVASIKGNAPDASGDWGIVQMPERAGNWGGSYIAIPKESDQPEEAYEFVEWLVAPERQLESFKDSGMFPSAPEVYEDEEFANTSDEYFGGLNTAEIFAEAAESVEPIYMGKNYSIVHDELMTALTNVASEGTDPQDEWDAAVERIKSQLERQ
ncbi:extracellular solute-binding protein [Jeotgalibacillus sp. ET6]|uniref:ABC transporter substrate-binding protein n=1 Tax=Jeotgalibacillus sp. ET6 TaxID=3037260 RepID=UPI0024185AB8|nr:extracellular solute-binding protein [Jeotgalibacillus sp. ET6]MDG5472208.1 extracellular solute-binding protein [Jeotgalibacillus sp. ET6]